MRRRTTKTPARSPWQRVRVRVMCTHGEFIDAGSWAYFGPWRPDRPRFVVCATHAEQDYRMRPPDPTFSCGPDTTTDVRARQAGEDR